MEKPTITMNADGKSGKIKMKVSDSRTSQTFDESFRGLKKQSTVGTITATTEGTWSGYKVTMMEDSAFSSDSQSDRSRRNSGSRATPAGAGKKAPAPAKPAVKKPRSLSSRYAARRVAAEIAAELAAELEAEYY